MRIVKEAVKTGEFRRDVIPKLLRDVLFGAIEHLAWRHVIGRGQLKVTQTGRELTTMLTAGICVDEKLLNGCNFLSVRVLPNRPKADVFRPSIWLVVYTCLRS